MDLELTGKRAVVTGGSRGIGLAIARALAAEGCDVALIARGTAALDAAAGALTAASGRTVIGVPCDTGDDDAVAAMAAEVNRRLGGADILVNAAARPNTGAVVGIDGFDAAEFGEQVNVKVLGYLRCARAFVPGMRAARWGRIINISGLAARSTGSVTGTVRNVAVAALTKNLADELGRDGINVTVVHPGVTVTEKTPQILAGRAERAGVSVAEVERQIGASVSIGRIVTADEVAAVVAFLASPKSVAVNGDAITAGGGAVGLIYY
ncbi:SDR family oxidoreductase [Trebonia kvetii]|uniref:SDR family oxidoreductase n=1 Tax=Trebonia kvetii TaxID=2480626 RepID=A0A6P2BU98_9ACTN|nr:SDR family oxidoreductase [Trebonia kvetii]TVZ00793.1 SDR family oxidoreductase [Trebonia kvetii]